MDIFLGLKAFRQFWNFGANSKIYTPCRYILWISFALNYILRAKVAPSREKVRDSGLLILDKPDWNTADSPEISIE